MRTPVCLGEIVFVYKYDLAREEVPGGNDVVDESLEAEAVDEWGEFFLVGEVVGGFSHFEMFVSLVVGETEFWDSIAEGIDGALFGDAEGYYHRVEDAVDDLYQ